MTAISPETNTHSALTAYNGNVGIYEASSGTSVITPYYGNTGAELTGQFQDGIIKVEDEASEAIAKTNKYEARVEAIRLILSLGGLFIVGLSALAIGFFALFAAGLYKATFINPSLALFISLLSAGLAFEVIYSRKLVNKE